MNTPARPGDVRAAAITDNPTAIGHNRPPPVDPQILAEKEAQVVAFLDAAGEWLDLKEIQTDEQAGYLTDFIAGARAKTREIEEFREDAKRPHLEAGRAVDAAVKPLTEKLRRAPGSGAGHVRDLHRQEEARGRGRGPAAAGSCRSCGS